MDENAHSERPGISNVSKPKASWTRRLKCGSCKTSFTASKEALDCDGFKKDPNTYWFDGSAVSVAKFFVDCPGCDDVVLVPNEKIPSPVRREVHDSGSQAVVATRQLTAQAIPSGGNTNLVEQLVIDQLRHRRPLSTS